MQEPYERKIRHLQNDISRLTEKRDEYQRAAERVMADLGGKPPLRDRNWFFHSLLNGDVDRYERIHPLWRDHVRKARKASRLKGEVAGRKARLAGVVRRGMADSPGHRALSAKVDREKAARSACQKLLELVRRARNRIKRANKNHPRSDTARPRVDRDVREVAAALRAVRTQARVVNDKVAPHGSLNLKNIEELDTEFPGGTGDHKLRLKKYNAARAALSSLDTRAKSLLRDIKKRETRAEEERAQYLKNERARFSDDA